MFSRTTPQHDIDSRSIVMIASDMTNTLRIEYRRPQPSKPQEQLGRQCLQWLEDQVYSIREAATQNLQQLAQEFGSDWAKEHLVPQVLQKSRAHCFRLHPAVGSALNAQAQPAMQASHLSAMSTEDDAWWCLHEVCLPNSSPIQFGAMPRLASYLCLHLSCARCWP